MNAKLRDAVDLLRRWSCAAGWEFWPKEETLHGWFSAALVEAGFTKRPTEIIQELHFGEYEPDGLSPDVRVRVGQGHWRLDLGVLTEPATGQVRNIEALNPAPRLVVEVKSLNSAGSLKRSHLRRDMEKLSVVREHLLKSSWSNPDEEPICLLLVVATACKDATSEEEGRSSADRVAGWVEELRAEANGVVLEALLPDPL